MSPMLVISVFNLLISGHVFQGMNCELHAILPWLSFHPAQLNCFVPSSMGTKFCNGFEINVQPASGKTVVSNVAEVCNFLIWNMDHGGS